MKKKLFTVMIIAIIAISAGYNVYTSQHKTSLSYLTLNNIEALAWGWGEDSGWTAPPCVPCMPKSCSYTKFIGSQMYWVNEPWVEFAN